MKVWLVKRNSDMTEGRGPMVPVAIYNNMVEAIHHIESAYGVMGTRGEKAIQESGRTKFWANDHTAEEMTVFDNYQDFVQR